MRGARTSIFALSVLMAVAFTTWSQDASAATGARATRTTKKKVTDRSKSGSRSNAPTKKSTNPKKSRLAERLAKKKAKDAIPPKKGAQSRQPTQTTTSISASQRRTTTSSSSSRKKLTREQREQVAMTRVKDVLKAWTPKGVELNVRLKPQQLQVNPNNPVVGRGPVDIVVSPKVVKGASLITRLTRAFNPRLNRQLLVQVSESGHGTILAEKSNTLLHRTVGFVLGKLPVRELVFDAINSKESRSGLVLMIVSLASWKTNPQVAVGGLVMAGQMITAGTARRRVARTESMEATAKWITKRGKGSSGFPSLSESYLFYKGHLKNNKPGTRPLAFRRFIEQLTLQDVK